jgi:hypothetical protein
MWVELDSIATSANGGYPIDVTIKQSPAVQVITVDLPGGEDSDASNKLQPIELSVSLSIEPDTYTTAGFVTAANAVISQFYPDLDSNQGYKKFRYSQEPDKCIYVRPDGGYRLSQNWPVDERKQAEVEIPLRARTSYWLSNTATTGTIAAGATTGSVANDGNIKTCYTLTVTFTGAVSVFGVTGGGNALSVSGSFSAANTVVINTETKKILVDGTYIAAGNFGGEFPICPTGTQTLTKTSASVALSYSITKRYRS